MVINGAIVSDLDMMYIESVLQVSQLSVVGNESTFLPGIDHPEAGAPLFVTFQSAQVQLKQISAQIVFNLKHWVQIAAELPELILPYEIRCIRASSDIPLLSLPKPHGGLCFHYHPDIIRSLSKLYFALNYFPTLVHHILDFGYFG